MAMAAAMVHRVCWTCSTSPLATAVIRDTDRGTGVDRDPQIERDRFSKKKKKQYTSHVMCILHMYGYNQYYCLFACLFVCL